MPRPTLKFYCFQRREDFSTSEYGVQKKKKGKRVFYYAITEREGNKCIRAVNKAFYEKHK